MSSRLGNDTLLLLRTLTDTQTRLPVVAQTEEHRHAVFIQYTDVVAPSWRWDGRYIVCHQFRIHVDRSHFCKTRYALAIVDEKGVGVQKCTLTAAQYNTTECFLKEAILLLSVRAKICKYQ